VTTYLKPFKKGPCQFLHFNISEGNSLFLQSSEKGGKGKKTGPQKIRKAKSLATDLSKLHPIVDKTILVWLWPLKKNYDVVSEQFEFRNQFPSFPHALIPPKLAI